MFCLELPLQSRGCLCLDVHLHLFGGAGVFAGMLSGAHVRAQAPARIDKEREREHARSLLR